MQLFILRKASKILECNLMLISSQKAFDIFLRKKLFFVNLLRKA